jgi:hypothetical protein
LIVIEFFDFGKSGFCPTLRLNRQKTKSLYCNLLSVTGMSNFSLKTSSCFCINEQGKWCHNVENDKNAPKHDHIMPHRISNTFANVCLNNSNIVEYMRIFMTVVALEIVFLNKNSPSLSFECAISGLILSSVLLELVNRHKFHKSTVMCNYINVFFE